MYPAEEKEKCFGCAACKEVCPQKAISLTQEKGFLYPQINSLLCNECGSCRKICNSIHSSKAERNNLHLPFPKVFACQNDDIQTRLNSSSGGMFSLLADLMIQKGGVVIGAAFLKNKLTHIHAEEKSAIEKMRGSKYIQSNPEQIYSIIKNFLSQKRPILFTGTPCQVAALRQLTASYHASNLIICDLLCHGVASQKVFEKYQEYLEKRYRRRLKELRFRSKRSGWKHYSIEIIFEGNKTIEIPFDKDPFMIGYLKNLSLRASCYHCIFADLKRVGDITLGDFWGIHNSFPKLDDDTGTSLLLLNTQKGVDYLEELQKTKKFTIYPASLESAIKGNPILKEGVSCPKNRSLFFDDLSKRSFSFLKRKYLQPSSALPNQLKRKIRNILSKFTRL